MWRTMLRVIECRNKKVLLPERNRHTDRGVSSTTRDGVPPPHQGTPPPQPGLTGGYLMWGTPLTRSDGGGVPDGGPRWGNPALGYPPGQV